MTLSKLFKTISTEVAMNKGVRLKSIVLLFRLANYYYHGKSFLSYFFFPFALLYKVLVEFIFGVELPGMTKVGIGLRIFHGVGLVVHRQVVIGDYCILRHGVTLGNKGEENELVPAIGSYVEFGTNAVVIGGVEIGDHAVIGAGAVVTKDIAAGSVVVSPGFRVL